MTGMVSAAPAAQHLTPLGQTMLAVSKPSRGTGRVLYYSQETGHLSSVFVHSGDGSTTSQENQAPGGPDVGRR